MFDCLLDHKVALFKKVRPGLCISSKVLSTEELDYLMLGNTGEDEVQ